MASAMVQADLEQVLRIQAAYSMLEPKTREEWESILDTYPRGARVVRSQGELVAFSFWFPMSSMESGREPDSILIQHMAVPGQKRGANIEMVFLREAVDAALAGGLQWLRLFVTEAETEFWSGAGFFETSQRKGPESGSREMAGSVWTVNRALAGADADWICANRLNRARSRSNPVRSLLGFRVVAVDTAGPGAVWVQYDALNEFCHSDPPIVQGGLVAAFGDMAMAQLFVLSAMVKKQKVTAPTLDLSITYVEVCHLVDPCLVSCLVSCLGTCVQAARPGVINAIAWNLRRGATVAFLEAEVYDNSGVVPWPVQSHGRVGAQGSAPGAKLLAKLSSTFRVVDLNKRKLKPIDSSNNCNNDSHPKSHL